MKKSVNKLTIILFSIIIVLLIILIYGLYTGFKVKGIINSMQTEINQLNGDKDNLTSQLSSLHNQYNLLEQDATKIYKTCPYENACKGRFPNISWYCNNQGDYSPDISNAPYICVCSVDCQLTKTAVNQQSQPSSGY